MMAPNNDKWLKQNYPDAVKRRKYAYRRHKEGATWGEIGEELKISAGRARQLAKNFEWRANRK